MTDTEYAEKIREHIREINKLIDESKLAVDIVSRQVYKSCADAVFMYEANIRKVL